MPDQEKVLVLRTCAPDMSAYNGFKWKESGEVSASDWKPEARCGNGLHGLLWGCGDGGLLNWDPAAKWLVVEVEAASVVELDGKVKFPSGVVLFSGDRKGATELVASRAPKANLPIVGLAITAGYGGTATAGYGGTATAGDSGTATAGERGTATAGERGTLQIKRYDPVAGRYRTVTGYTGEDGIEANVPYKLDQDGKLVRKVP